MVRIRTGTRKEKKQVVECVWQLSNGWSWVVSDKWLDVCGSWHVVGPVWQSVNGWRRIAVGKWFEQDGRWHVVGARW